MAHSHRIPTLMIPPQAAAADALRHAVRVLASFEPGAARGWDRAGAPGGDPMDAAEAEERLARTGERRIWMAQDAARLAFGRAVTVYTRHLRHAGLPLARVLARVAAAVHGAGAPLLGPAALAELLEQGERLAVETYVERTAARARAAGCVGA